ncbi:hypothetical protein [Streptomyces coerulescens]|uniref:Uncharacterized protein n=1 Tax=Streptomyces coerulescens TaxID=29304 RepID=A0ABW0CXX1_STRCD
MSAISSAATKDSDTSHTVSANLAAAHTLGDEVDHLYYWDEGHGADADPGDFIESIAKISQHEPVNGQSPTVRARR